MSDKQSRLTNRSVTLAIIGIVLVCVAIGFVGSVNLGVTSATALLVVLLIFVSYTDLTSHRIPNYATYSVVIAALALNTIVSFSNVAGLEEQLGGIGIWNCLAGAATSFGLMLIAYALFGSGAGDVKLATAIGALMGVNFGISAIVWCHLTAALFIVLYSCWRRDGWTLLSSLVRGFGHWLFPIWVLAPSQDQQVTLTTPIPLAVFFGLGTAISALGIQI